jgi:penicillin-binding protein 1C
MSMLPGHGWLPWPGKHILALTDRAGRVLDQVSFEVRGALVKRKTMPLR